MNILYITENYFESKVHNNLIVRELEQKKDLTVYVFSPLRGDIEKDLSCSFVKHERLIVIAPQIDIPISLYRYDFWAKLRCKVKLIEKNIPIKTIDAVHAATLFSDGGVALRLQKRYHIPYFVSVRGSDSVFYAKRMFHLWPMANNIIKKANALAFVTEAIKIKMISYVQFVPSKKKLKESPVINNGVDDIWISNLHVEVKPIQNPVRMLYIGRFDGNKNVLSLINAMLKVKETTPVKLTMIGGNGPYHKDILSMVEQHPDCLEYLGEIYDKQRLMEIVRQCDIFAMVSHGETFGLVYAECLTQGLPLLYTQGTGFDEMYPQGYVGYAVDSNSVDSIAEGLKQIISHYDGLRKNISQLDFKRYNWDKIAHIYSYIYTSIQAHRRNKKGVRGGLKDLYYTMLRLIRILPDKFNHNHINATARIGRGASVKESTIGSYSYVSSGCTLYNVEVGNYCCFGPGVDIGGMQHPYWWYSMSPHLSDKCELPERTYIGHDVWLGVGCIIKQGVKVGNGAVVGANSFVNHDVEPYSIVVGSPAKHLKYRFDEDVRKAIEQTGYWRKEPTEARMLLETLEKL